MALTGKLLADFSSFSDAVRKADVELRGMETGAGKVEKSLNRMVDNFSGRKLAQDAVLVAEAVERIGGASKLTEREQASVNRTVTEALAKYQALGQVAPANLRDLAAATTKVVSETQKIASETQKVSKGQSFFNDLTGQVKATALGMISATAVIGGVQTAFRTLTDFVGSSIDSFASAEAAQKKLTTALTTTGQATPGIIDGMNALATQFQKTTVYGDDLITEMQSLLVQVGNVGPSQMGKALKASTDLASGLGIDLTAATTLVAKAFAGGGDELGRLKAVLGDTMVAGSGMTGVMDAINQKFGGQAQAEIDTYAGRIKQMANEWDNFKETVGAAIVLDPTVIALLNFLTKGAQGAGGITGGLADLGDRLGMGLGPGLQILDAYASSINAADKAARDAAALVDLPAEVGNAWANLIPPSAVDQARELLKSYKPLTDEQKKAQAEAAKHAQALKELNARFVDAERALVPLTAAQQQQITHYRNLNLSVSDIATKMRLGQREVQLWADAIAAAGRISSQTIPLINKFGESLAHSADGLVKMIEVQDRAWPTMITGLEAVFSANTKNIIQMKTLGDTITDNVLGAFGRIPDLMEKAFTGGGNMIGAMKAIGVAMADAITTPILAGLDKMQKAAVAAGAAAATAFGGAAGGGMGAQVAGIVAGLGGAALAASSWGTAMAGAGVAGTVALGAATLGIGAAAVGVAVLVKHLTDSKGRDAVKKFADDQGGFDKLHAKLLEMGAQGEALWIKLTQGVGKNNPKQAAAVIDEITAAWERHAKSVSEAEAAVAKQAAEQSEAHQKALDEIKGLDDQIESLNRTVANEAPEEVMGVIEQQTRAQIDAIQKQRDAAQKAIDDTAGSAADSAEEAAKEIDRALAEHEFIARLKFDLSDLPRTIDIPATTQLPGFATGTAGYQNFGRGTAVMLHGWEKVTPRSKAGDDDGGYVPITIMTPIGEVVAREIVRVKKRLRL